MEVIGLVAAIPGLIQITKKTISVIRGFIDQNSFVKQMTELLDQLELIENILQDILSRLKSKAIRHSDIDRLNTTARGLKGELIALSDLFQPLAASPGRKAKVLNRARLLICGLEGKIKKYHERLGSAKSSLMLVIAAQNEAINEVLAASIVQKLKSQANFAVGFSFWAGSHNQQKLLAFLRTFLWYMIQQIPDDNLAQVSAPLLESLPLTEKALGEVISIAIKTIKSPVYCVIDGIDESVDDWTRPDAGGLRLVLDLTKAYANLRVVLLGRDASMRSAASLTPRRIEVTEELVRPDINQLILYHLDSSLKIQDAATRQLVQETLQETSRVMFLWVTLIFGELKRCQLPNEIVHTLHQVPRNLDREYYRLFFRFQDRLGGTRHTPSLSMERAKCLLSWIIASPEPLTYEELRCAFAISQCPDKGYEQYMISEDGIMDTCGDFIRVSDGRYHMIHASIVEFLTRPIELWQYEDETIDYFRIDVPQGQSLMCLQSINYFQRTDLGYPLTDASVAMSHVNLPIFSCALKFALIYLTGAYASEHLKEVCKYVEDFMKTSQFCSLIECGFLILQHESATSLGPHVEIMKSISWMAMNESFDQLPITQSLLETTFKEELARREKVFGLDDDRFRTWKSFIDILTLEDSQITVSAAHNVEGNVRLKDIETVFGNDVDRPRQTMNLKARRAAEHTAILKIGDMVAAKAPVLQALTRSVPRFTSIIPELLPIPFLILLAIRETNNTRKEHYWSTALKRLTGSNNFFEALCAFQLGHCRYWEDRRDETVEGLLNRCRQIAMNLPSSLHVDLLLCSTLGRLTLLLVWRDHFLKAQEIVSELQQRLSNGPTKGSVSTPLKRNLYRLLFWDDWQATLLANIAEFHTLWERGDAYYATALSIVDSNIQLYKNPGHRRVNASITAHSAKALALSRQWQKDGSKIPSELARECEAACRVVLQLAKFPNSVKYIDEQWWVLEVLCCLLYKQRRYREARELISRIPADLPPTKCTYDVICVAATAACLADLETAKAFLERASLEIQGQQVSLLRSESKHVTKLIAALIKVRPTIQLWLLVLLCCQQLESQKNSKALHERDFWYEYARSADEDFNDCFQELWDIFYIRYLALTNYDDDHAQNMMIRVRGYEYAEDTSEYTEDASEYAEDASEGEEFALGCEIFAFDYAREQKYEAAAIVSRYLISYALQRNTTDSFQWSLYYAALSLHFAFRGEEALALCRSMLLWTEKCSSCEYKWWGYLNVGIACFMIGDDHERNRNPLSAEFFKLAVILRWLSESRFELEELGVAIDSLEPIDSPKANPNIRAFGSIELPASAKSVLTGPQTALRTACYTF
ncbi:hypothetical protein E0Z10_g4063 [Xylaria hypoxylon]|uniref:Nephrocystin 3-like N-terminal domain-containing protein n=1 Tax=Xylaria hypoxylon TaxID=37992 RepID=A0A4Z0Z005_9PEZI|nr:hypothetical protein E0Z10_g4063 [Xylaria hypoxylon]